MHDQSGDPYPGLGMQLGVTDQNITGQISNLLHHEIEVEDTAVAYIEFENGVAGTFFGTVTYVKNSSIELQAVCEKGSFTIKDYGLWYGPKENENEKHCSLKINVSLQERKLI